MSTATPSLGLKYVRNRGLRAAASDFWPSASQRMPVLFWRSVGDVLSFEILGVEDVSFESESDIAKRA